MRGSGWGCHPRGETQGSWVASWETVWASVGPSVHSSISRLYQQNYRVILLTAPPVIYKYNNHTHLTLKPRPPQIILTSLSSLVTFTGEGGATVRLTAPGDIFDCLVVLPGATVLLAGFLYSLGRCLAPLLPLAPPTGEGRGCNQWQHINTIHNSVVTTLTVYLLSLPVKGRGYMMTSHSKHKLINTSLPSSLPPPLYVPCYYYYYY